MSLNLESVLEELDIFDSSELKDDSLPQILEDYLIAVAKNGKIIHPWPKLKPLLKCKIDQVLGEFSKVCPTDTIPSLPNTDAFNFDNLKNGIFEAIDAFESAPFTIQRICELITNPRKHYNRTDKYMRGLEKNLLVVSTVEPKSGEDSNQQAIKNQPTMVNGVDSVNNSEYDCGTGDMQPVNGTVLENFASVFPSAPHITNPPSNIQVAIVTGSDSYHTDQNISTFTYCTDNGDEGFHDAPEPSITYETNGAEYCEPETGDKYIIIEELSGQEINEAAENDFQDTGDVVYAENQCTDPSIELVSSSELDGSGDVDNCNEPERKRRKISLDSEDNCENILVDHCHIIRMDVPDDAVPEDDAQPSTNYIPNVPISEDEPENVPNTFKVEETMEPEIVPETFEDEEMIEPENAHVSFDSTMELEHVPDTSEETEEPENVPDTSEETEEPENVPDTSEETIAADTLEEIEEPENMPDTSKETEEPENMPDTSEEIGEPEKVLDASEGTVEPENSLDTLEETVESDNVLDEMEETMEPDSSEETVVISEATGAEQ